jgi:hypothetical protein
MPITRRVVSARGVGSFCAAMAWMVASIAFPPASMAQGRMDGPMPNLEPPAGVNPAFHGHCSVGMGRGREEAVLLSTRDSPRDIASHFGPQLADQGWVLDSDLVGDTMASQMWTRTDAEGKSWRGILFVAALGEDTRDVSFSVLPRE